MYKLNMESKDIMGINIEKIGAIFPQVLTESLDENGRVVKSIDFDKLKQELSNELISGKESYDFNWVGKRKAIIDSNTPINKTLRPCKNESKNWDTTENLYIEGDNLEVLKLLQESYFNKVKMIYIDPPYNTGKDFIYKDNFTRDKDSYEEEQNIKDEEGNRLFQNTETNGRFHSDWCSMIYARLRLAKNLLKDDGVIFISIDDNEVHNLRNICDEVFGEQNFVCDFIRKTKSTTNDNKTGVNIQHENCIVYAKEKVKCFLSGEEKDFSRYTNPDNDPSGAWISDNPSARTGSSFPIVNPYNGKVDYPPENRQWLFSEASYNKFVTTGKIKFRELIKDGERGFIFKRYLKEVKSNIAPVNSLLGVDNEYMNQNATKLINNLFPNIKVFDYTKPLSFMKILIKSGVEQNSNDIILDFFSGSATTAHAVMQLNADDGGNRKYILVQLPEECKQDSEAYQSGYKNICEIGKERIRRAGDKILSEWKEKNNEDLVNSNIQELTPPDIGFRVFKVDSSNMKDVYFTPDKYKQENIDWFYSNVKDDRNDLDLLYSVLLECGVELTYPHKTEKIDGNDIHIIGDNDLIACFSDKITEETINAIAYLKPLKAVFKDSSFNTDDQKINLEEIFKLKSSNTIIKVI